MLIKGLGDSGDNGSDLLIKTKVNNICQTVYIFANFKSKVFEKPDWKPVDNLSDWDKADPKAEAADPAEAGDEVEPGHLRGSLKLCGKILLELTSKNPKKRWIDEN